MSRRFPSTSQARLRRTSVPADPYLPASLHAQGAELVKLRLRSEDAEEATRAAEAAVDKAKLEDAAVLRKAASDPDASPDALRKAATAHHEADALLVLARTERTEQAILDVQIAAEGRWTRAMRMSAKERVALVQSLCEESSLPVRKAAAALIASRSVYLGHVTALSVALDDDLGANPHTNIAPSTWRPSTKSDVRYAPGGTSDHLDLSKLQPALKADAARHISPTPKPSDVHRQAGEEIAAVR